MSVLIAELTSRRTIITAARATRAACLTIVTSLGGGSGCQAKDVAQVMLYLGRSFGDAVVIVGGRGDYVWILDRSGADDGFGRKPRRQFTVGT